MHVRVSTVTTQTFRFAGASVRPALVDGRLGGDGETCGRSAGQRAGGGAELPGLACGEPAVAL